MSFLSSGGSGSGGSGAINIALPTETPNGTLKVFTFSTLTIQPSVVVSDGVSLSVTSKIGNTNWTWNGISKQITLSTTSAPPTDNIFAIQ